MIACECCPSPSDCREYGRCLNAVVVQRSVYYEEAAEITPAAWQALKPVIQPCWHQYAPAQAGAVITIRECLHCGQPEF